MPSDTRSPEEIERDIERERAGLTDTLDDLQDKFSVDTIVRQFSDQFRDHGGDIGRSVSDAVKRNPVALALTGVGLAWLMMGDRSGERNTSDRDRRYPQSGLPDRYTGRYGDEYADPRRASYLDDDDRVGRTGLPSRTSSSTLDRNLDSRNTPSWARTEHQDGPGMAERMQRSATHAGAGVSSAAASTADSARNAGSTVADKASGARDAVADAGKSVADSAQNFASSTSNRAAAMRDRLAEGTENLSDEARMRVVAARQSAIEARDAAMSYTRQGRDRAVDLFEEQPLIAGALAVALGAALGAALPRSRIEDDYLGEQSDHLMEEAERIFAEERQKLDKVAAAATDEAKKVLNETKDDADSVAKAAVDKARDSGQRVADAAESEAQKQDVGGLKKS